MAFRPIYNPGNDVIDAYLKGKQLAQQATKNAADKEIALKQLDQAKSIAEAELKQKHEYEQAQIEHNQSSLALQHSAERRAQAEAFSKFGISEGQVTPANQPSVPQNQVPETTTGFEPVTPQNAPISRQLPGEQTIPQGYVSIDHPILGKFLAPTHETFLKQAEELKQAEVNPEIAKEIAKQKAEDARQWDIESLKVGAENTRVQAQINAANERNAATLKNRLEVEGLKNHNDKSIAATNRITNAFETNPNVKAFDVVNIAKQNADKIPNSNLTGVQQTTLLNAYATALSPGRASTGTNDDYLRTNSQSLLDTLRGKVTNIFDTKGIMTPDTIKSIKDTINAVHSTYRTNYLNLQKQHQDQLKLEGGNPGILLDHTKNTVRSKADVQKFADANKIDYTTAKEHYESSGYTIDEGK